MIGFGAAGGGRPVEHVLGGPAWPSPALQSSLSCARARVCDCVCACVYMGVCVCV
jgi:hypothetical protein